MFAELIGAINNALYSYILIILLLAVGLYFSLRTKFVQFRLLGESIRVVGEKSGDKNSVSAFEALMVSTASRVGTGNIVGVANAIAIGGYGSVFWMWIIALVGGASAFVESTLAQVYKKKAPDGSSYGGPSYYIQAALNSRVLGVVFALALIATYAGGFNMLAEHTVWWPWWAALCWPFWWVCASWAAASASSRSPACWSPSWACCTSSWLWWSWC